MNPTRHPTNTKILNAPPEWDHSKVICEPLGVTEHLHEGCAAISSFWRPEPAELKALNEGGFVTLTVFGMNHPAVMVRVAEKS